jgi:hypothetical protein
LTGYVAGVVYLGLVGFGNVSRVGFAHPAGIVNVSRLGIANFSVAGDRVCVSAEAVVLAVVVLSSRG